MGNIFSIQGKKSSSLAQNLEVETGVEFYRLIQSDDLRGLERFFRLHPTFRCDRPIPYLRESPSHKALPFHLAFYMNPRPNAEVAELLLNKGADPLSFSCGTSPFYSLFFSLVYDNFGEHVSLPHFLEVISVFGKHGICLTQENQQELIDKIFNGTSGFTRNAAQMILKMQKVGMLEEGNDILSPWAASFK